MLKIFISTKDINKSLAIKPCLAKIEKGIIVRDSNSGEEFTALDNKKYKLEKGMCVISDHKGVLGLGGIIGGLFMYGRFNRMF